MRTKLPVIGIEYILQDGQSIVSKTDTKGRITYVNPSLVEVSGFELDELIGKAHNIVRHPDMPPEAFADLWQTLKAGLPWTGMVKNRRKNGDFYRVVANVVPIKENGVAVGYMSVRTRPQRERVAEAEALYRRFREGKAAGLAIRRGAFARTGWVGRLEALRTSTRCSRPRMPCTPWPAATFRACRRPGATTKSAACCWRCASQTMREVVVSVQEATRIMHGITDASREQHGGIAQVSAAMRELDGITRENAALVEEAAAASSNVAKQAAHLSQALSVFRPL